jgi:hypothetical protein
MINNNIDGVSQPSEFNINYVRIVTQQSDAPVDITKLVNYIEIYESIYSPFLTVNVNITDAISLNNMLPLIGEEFIEFDIRGPDNETGLIKQPMFIYKMSDRIQAADKAFVYTISCISPAAIIDMNLKISQAISGQPSDIVEKQLCKSSLSIEKPIYSHPTKHQVSYISNYWSPVENIKYLCDRAVSLDSSSPSYLFFETKKSFVFAPLSELVRQDAGSTYFFSINTHDTDVDIQQQVIQKLYVDQTFNYIDRIRSGTYGNRVLIVDTKTKLYQYDYYDFLESFDKFNRLNELPFGSDNATRRVNSVFRTRTVAANSVPQMPTEHNREWFKQRLTELGAINSQSISMDVAGKFNVYAGTVINVVIPTSLISNDGSKAVDLNNILDRTLSGRYLVTSIKHMLTRERHTLSITASKDSILKT